MNLYFFLLLLLFYFYYIYFKNTVRFTQSIWFILLLFVFFSYLLCFSPSFCVENLMCGTISKEIFLGCMIVTLYFCLVFKLGVVI